ncbi:MAG TPA: HNH endonuclease [Solirubrobacteraceae bacterium]|nr:HNH endonuclease [Solirubrobacteraceae bacterium]
MERARDLQHAYTDVIPISALREGFTARGRRVSFGSFYSGIFRPKECRDPGAVCLVTTPPKVGRAAPYEDEFDEATGRFTYRFRDPQSTSTAALRQAEADNRAMLAAFELAAPIVYFRGIAPGQYCAVAPAFIVAIDRGARVVWMEAGMPTADMTPAGLRSDADLRRYATREALFRLHQQRFRAAVLQAYSTRCAVCRLREASLLQASHIIDDREPGGAAAVVNGIALCAIHHLAYDRNLMGIDPDGVVHIARRLLDEVDGPMLRSGLQGFHGAAILKPRRTEDRPDPARLEIRYDRFRAAA